MLEDEEDHEDEQVKPNSPSMWGYGPSVYSPPNYFSPPHHPASLPWYRRINWENVAGGILLIIFFALAVVGLFSAMNTVMTPTSIKPERHCQAVAEKMELPWFYSVDTGCMIQVMNRWYPSDKLQFFVPPGE